MIFFHLTILKIFYLFLKGISPDIVTYSTLMKAFIRARKFQKVQFPFQYFFYGLYLLNINMTFLAGQVPEIYKEMESVGCTPDRKAREMLQIARMALEQRHCKYKISLHQAYLWLSVYCNNL